MNKDLTTVSKFLSLVLRHDPGAIGLTLDPHGWADVDDLLDRAALRGRRITRELLERVVAENDKKRFAFSDDGRRVRASQGHSVAVDLALAPVEPPEVLYHGTATRFLDSIRAGGLIPGSRRHVYLSAEHDTAVKVGTRHGKPHVLSVRAGDMHRAGLPFYRSDNGVWLTDVVPTDFIDGW